MFHYVDELAFTNDQGARAQKLFAAVVLAALDDAIADDKKYGNGPDVIARWARSRDGREVLMCAGIDPNERTNSIMPFTVRSFGSMPAHMRTSRPSRERAQRAITSGPFPYFLSSAMASSSAARTTAANSFCARAPWSLVNASSST